jgi:hypothetical protein
MLVRFGLQGRSSMPSKPRRLKPFKASAAVKAAAREKIGEPPPSRATPTTKQRNAKAPKYKPTLDKLLEESE